MKKALTILVLTAMMLTSACGNGGTSAPQSSGQTPPSSSGTPTVPSLNTSGNTSVPSGTGSGEVQAAGSGTSAEPAQSTQGATSVPAPAGSETAQPEGSNSNILVAYFSRVGNTVWEDGVDAVTSATLNVVDGEFAGNAQLLAGMAQQATGGDLF